MKGVETIEENEVIATTMAESTQPSHTDSLGSTVKESLQKYFAQLDGQTPANLYNLVLAEVEKPLIKMVLKLTNNNQSKAAKILGISRGTLRKKMAMYALN